MTEVRIQILREGVSLPKYHTAESAGFDLAAAEDVSVAPKAIAKVPTGLSIESPVGHFLLLSARSSLAGKMGLMLANGVGTIDRDYSGPEDEIFISVYNFTEYTVELKKGDRIAQGIFIPTTQAIFVESEMRTESRGGFGSTGGYSA